MPRRPQPAPDAPKPRRARGTGALFYSERLKKYVGRVEVGRDAAGNIVYATRTHANQDEVVRRLKEVKPPTAADTLASCAARWLAEMRVRPNTEAMRRNSVKSHINPVIGGQKAAALTRHQVESAARSWADAGLEPSSVKLVLSHLHTLFEEVVRWGVRPDNPVTGARRPKKSRPKIDPFTADELRRIAAEALRRPTDRFLAVLATAGCRVGEVLALTAADFDPEAGTVQITKTQDQRRRAGPPKSDNGYRTVRLVAPARAAARAALAGRASGALFPNDRGQHSHHTSARRAWVRLCQRLKLRFRNLHQLRHSVATHAIAAGVPIGNVARDLGDSPETVVRTYLHAVDGRSVSDAMDALFAGGVR